MQINVLWIDDQPNNAFIDKADLVGINIVARKNVETGIEELMSSNTLYDAIILDANCIAHSNDSNIPDVSALAYALKKINENRIDLPWFVYSGGGFSGEEHIDVIVKPQEREYDTKHWYKKPVEMNELFDKIKDVVPNYPKFKLKSKYSDIFSWLPAELTSEVLDLLSIVENGDNTNVDVFNKIRKVIDWTMRALNSYGILAVDFKGANLNECSSFLGRHELQQYIPSYIQRSFHSCTEIANEGSHRLRTDEDVRSGMAPYLVKSTTFELLNILMWYSKLPKDENTMRTITSFAVNLANKPKQDNNTAKEGIFEYENKSFIIEIDDQGNYHCDKCLLNKSAAYHYLEQQVILKSVTNNTSNNKDLYPYFAKFDPIDKK